MIKSKILKDAIKSIPKHTELLVNKQMEIAIQLKEILKNDKKITQKMLAEKTGLKESYISRVMAGNSNLTLSTITKIEAFLNKDLVVIPKYYDKIINKEISMTQSQEISIVMGFVGSELPIKKTVKPKSITFLNRPITNSINQTGLA